MRKPIDFGPNNELHQFSYDHEDLLGRCIDTIRREIPEGSEATIHVALTPKGDLSCDGGHPYPILVNNREEGEDVSNSVEIIQNVLEQIRNLEEVEIVKLTMLSAQAPLEQRRRQDEEYEESRLRQQLDIERRRRQEEEEDAEEEEEEVEEEDEVEEGLEDNMSGEMEGPIAWPDPWDIEGFDELLTSYDMRMIGRGQQDRRGTDGRRHVHLTFSFDGARG